MKPLLYLLVKNPFTKRDFERMGIESLEKHFEVHVLDCAAWLMPQALATRGRSSLQLPNLHLIGSLAELKGALKGSSGGIAIDYVGQFSLKAIWLFHCLKKKGIKLVLIDSGAHPFPEERNITKFSVSNIVYALKNRYIQRGINALIRRAFLKALPDQLPDFALVSGTYWMGSSRFNSALVKIDAHSFDYEKFLQIRTLPPSRNFDYAVYLDENIAGHEDNSELGYAAPVSERKFFESLNKFFLGFEAVSGMPVLVAGYPTDSPESHTQLFNGREVIYGETAELIRNARVVFAHGSTAHSFAVLSRCPAVFLTSNEMTSSWYYPWIEAIRRSLNARMVNIDNVVPEPQNIADWLNVDQDAYKLHEETYIKSQGSPDVSLWSIFLRVKSDEAALK